MEFTKSLQHHGILGQKWGKRNGPPYPLGPENYSEAEKRKWKKNFKQISKEYRRDQSNYGESRLSSSQPYRVSQQTKDDINSKAATIIDSSEHIQEQIKRVSELEKEWLDAYSKNGVDEMDFYESKECEEATEKAYQDTIDYLKKVDPNYLSQIIESNGGSTEDLDRYHDFRKVFESFEDEAFDEARDKWDQTERGKEASLVNEKYAEYNKALNQLGKSVSSEMLGEYGNKKLSLFDSETYSDLVNNTIHHMLHMTKWSSK